MALTFVSDKVLRQFHSKQSSIQNEHTTVLHSSKHKLCLVLRCDSFADRCAMQLWI